MNRYVLLLALVFGLAACADEAVQGTEAADNCTEVQCPTGTSPVLQSEAESACGGSAGVERGLTDLGVSASAQCFGTGSCSLICEPPAPCCGGEEWTETSYKCDTPCAAVCSCDGKCGKVTGADCEAECGDCSGGQVCSADNVCVDECPEGAEVCGDECFFPVDGDVCFNGEVCEAAKNCEGKACGSDGCGGTCGSCGSGESCDNGQCYADCKGSLPVCQDDVVQHCVSTNESDPDAAWAWQDKKDCSELSDTPYCDELSSGASCVECTEDGGDEQCGVGKACDTENGVCIDTCVPDCTNDDGSKRYCGGDGCGGFCEGVDYSCNGNGNWCNPENGKCDTPLEECSFSFQIMSNGEPSGNWEKVVIPYGNPFCNSVVPDLGIILDDELPPEAVVSGHVDMGKPDESGNIAEPFENVCSWKIHEFDSGNKVKCGEQLCSMVQIPADQNPLEYVKKTKLNEEDFCCKEATSCEEVGLLEDQSFCNTPDHPAFQTVQSSPWCLGDEPTPIEEGILLRCQQTGKIAEFKCEDCEKAEDGSWISSCSQDGWGCFETEWQQGDGGCGPDGCGPEFPEGTILGSCQESKADFCDTQFLSGCTSTNYDDQVHGYSTCAYDPKTNQISFGEEVVCDPGLVCVDAEWVEGEPDEDQCWHEEGELDDTCLIKNVNTWPNGQGPPQGTGWAKRVGATCEAPVYCPTTEWNYDLYCNHPDSPGYLEAYPETAINMCLVAYGVNTPLLLPNGDCDENPNDDSVGICVQTEGSFVCDMSQEGTCVSIEPTCVIEADGSTGIETCSYEPSTNKCNCAVEYCGVGEACGNFTQTTDGANYAYQTYDGGPVCEPKKLCPEDLPTETGRVCNDASNPWHQAHLPENSVIQCSPAPYDVTMADNTYVNGANHVEWTVYSDCGASASCWPMEGFWEAKCEYAQECDKKAWCGDNLESAWACKLDQNTGQTEDTQEGCSSTEKCYWLDGSGEPMVTPVMAEGIEAPNGAVKCVDLSCGPPSALPGSNYQSACGDYFDTCYTAVSNPTGSAQFSNEIFGNKVVDLEGCNEAALPTDTNGLIPWDGLVEECTFQGSHGCLPKDQCPTGDGTWTIERTADGAGESFDNPSKVVWVSNKKIPGGYFKTQENYEDVPGFIFACLESDLGVQYPMLTMSPEGKEAGLYGQMYDLKPEYNPVTESMDYKKMLHKGPGPHNLSTGFCSGPSSLAVQCCLCASMPEMAGPDGAWPVATPATAGAEGMDAFCKGEACEGAWEL